MRKNVYPKWVQSGRMKPEAADHEISVMQAVHDALTALAQKRPQPDQPQTTDKRAATSLEDDLIGALSFIMAFYEPGQRHLDTEAWKVAEARGRHALARAGKEVIRG